MFVGSEDLAVGKDIDWTTQFDGNLAPPNNSLQYFKNVTNWTKLSNEECIQTYGQSVVTAHGDVLAVSSAWENPSLSLANGLNARCPVEWIAAPNAGSQSSVPYSWMCQKSARKFDPFTLAIWTASHTTALRWMFTSGTKSLTTCDVGNIDPKNWTIADAEFKPYPVQYCYSRPVAERCKLQFSLAIMSIVIVCNLVKMMCMLLMLLHQRSKPLVTLGDAIESFLVKPDPTTNQGCLVAWVLGCKWHEMGAETRTLVLQCKCRAIDDLQRCVSGHPFICASTSKSTLFSEIPLSLVASYPLSWQTGSKKAWQP